MQKKIRKKYVSSSVSWLNRLFNLSPATTSAVSSSANDNVLDLCEVIPEVEFAASYEENCRNDKIPMIMQMYLRRKKPKPSREGRIVNVEGSRRNSRPGPSSSYRPYDSGPSSNYDRSDDYHDDYEDEYYDVEAEYYYYDDGDDGYGIIDMVADFFFD